MWNWNSTSLPFLGGPGTNTFTHPFVMPSLGSCLLRLTTIGIILPNPIQAQVNAVIGATETGIGTVLVQGMNLIRNSSFLYTGVAAGPQTAFFRDLTANTYAWILQVYDTTDLTPSLVYGQNDGALTPTPSLPTFVPLPAAVPTVSTVCMINNTPITAFPPPWPLVGASGTAFFNATQFLQSTTIYPNPAAWNPSYTMVGGMNTGWLISTGAYQ